MEGNIVTIQQLYRKLLLVFVVLVVVVPNVYLVVAQGYVLEEIDTTSQEHPALYCIEHVAYVGQMRLLYCLFACPAMVLQYYGFNTSVYDVLFQLGAGYALTYSTPYMVRMPEGSGMVCRWDNDCMFLASLYGLEYERWQAEYTWDEAERWEQYWWRVKDTVSKHIPVITNVDPLFLPSVQQPIRNVVDGFAGRNPWLFDRVWKNLPNTVLHQILIVGYNENNNSVCYHDPGSALWGAADQGRYVWMDMDVLRQSLHSLFSYRDFSYYIEVFINTSESPLAKDEMYRWSHERNIQKMRGNQSMYHPYITDEWGCTEFGINAIHKLRDDLSPGLKTRMTTYGVYKHHAVFGFLSTKYHLMSAVHMLHPLLFEWYEAESLLNHYRQIALEKEDIAAYLYVLQFELHDSVLADTCAHQALLLQQEAEKWRELSDLFELFLKHGARMSWMRGLFVLSEMHMIVDEIICIQESIMNYNILEDNGF